MEQKEARRRAKELGGIATLAKRRKNGWLTSVWGGAKDTTWIVLSLDGKKVLDDGTPKLDTWSPWDDDTEIGGPTEFYSENNTGMNCVRVRQDEDDPTGRTWRITVIIGLSLGGEYHNRTVTVTDVDAAKTAAMAFAVEVTA